MPSRIVEAVKKEMAVFDQIWAEDCNRPPSCRIFPDKDNLHPIPFFGELQRAEVVTLALNPSHAEFSIGRWPVNGGSKRLTPNGLTNRLLSYFHSPIHPANAWFDECEAGLLALGCSYQTNAAHIDVHPFPTKFARDMNEDEQIIVGGFIHSQCADHLVSILSLFEQLKLIIAVDFFLPAAGGGNRQTTFDFARERLSALSGVIDANGSKPPMFRGGGHNRIAKHLFDHRNHLRSFLLNAPSLIFSS